jgi:hypothetical protein
MTKLRRRWWRTEVTVTVAFRNRQAGGATFPDDPPVVPGGSERRTRGRYHGDDLEPGGTTSRAATVPSGAMCAHSMFARDVAITGDERVHA